MLLQLVHDLQEGRDIVVLHLGEWNVDEVEGVEGAIAGLVHQFELNEQDIFLQLCLLVVDWCVALLLKPLGCLLVQNTVLEVGLGERSVHLVDLLDFDIFRNHTVTVQKSLSLLSSLVEGRTHISARHFFVLKLCFWVAAILIHHILVALGVGALLVDQAEADVVFELRYGKVELIMLLKRFEQKLGKRSDDRFFIVVDHVLEKLIYELNLEIGQIEPGIIVAIEGISKVEHNLVPFVLAGWVEELTNPPVAQLQNLGMAGNEAVKFELLQIGLIEIRYAFVFVRNDDTLKDYE